MRFGNTQHPAALPYLMEALHDSSWWYEREQGVGDLLLAIEKIGNTGSGTTTWCPAG